MWFNVPASPIFASSVDEALSYTINPAATHPYNRRPPSLLSNRSQQGEMQHSPRMEDTARKYTMDTRKKPPSYGYDEY